MGNDQSAAEEDLYPHQQHEHHQRENDMISNSKATNEGVALSDPIQPPPSVPTEGVSTVEVNRAVRDASAPKDQCASSCCKSAVPSEGDDRKDYTYVVPKVPKQKYKSWRVQVIPASERAKKAVQERRYECSKIVIGIVCEGDKHDGYNGYPAAGYGGYGRSMFGDLDQRKYIMMNVKVTDKISIQQNKVKHWLEFWLNGHMFKKVIALDPKKKFQIRVGSTNHDYDVKLQ